MLRALLVTAFLLAGCGSDPTLGGSCNATCDCPVINAPIKCVGEWDCNSNKRCQYTCKSTCDSSGALASGSQEESGRSTHRRRALISAVIAASKPMIAVIPAIVHHVPLDALVPDVLGFSI